MKKHATRIGTFGFILVIASLNIMITVFPVSNVNESSNLYIPSIFEGMFNPVSNNIQILPGEFGYFSYSTKSSNVPLLWVYR